MSDSFLRVELSRCTDEVMLAEYKLGAAHGKLVIDSYARMLKDNASGQAYQRGEGALTVTYHVNQ